MAKNNKNGTTKGDMMKVASFLAFVAMVLAIVLLLVSAIIKNSQITSILMFVKDIALLAALAIPAFYFTKGKPKWVKIVYLIVLVCFIAAAVFGNALIK